MSNLLASQWTASTSLTQNQLSLAGQLFWVMDAQKSYSFTNPTGDNKTIRYEVRQGDVWLQGDGNIAPLKNRSEIGSTTQLPMYKDIHIAYTWTWEAGHVNTAPWMTCAQLRQLSNESKSAPFAFMFYGNDNLHVVIGTQNGFSTVFSDPNPMVRDHPYKMTIDCKFDETANGYLKITRDGVTIVDYKGSFGWSGMTSVYWKEGVYRADVPEPCAMVYGDLQIAVGVPLPAPPPPPVSPPPPPVSPPPVDPQIAALQAQVASLQTQLTTANTTITGLQSSLASANTSLTSCQATVTSLNTRIANIKASITQIQSLVNNALQI